MFRQLIGSVSLTAQVLGMFLFSETASAAEPVVTKGAEPVSEAVVKANNEFACDLYQKLATREGNLFFSPVSISSVLGMLEVGAGGATKQEIRKVLHLTEGVGKTPDECGLKEILNKSGDGYRLKTANAIWGAKGLAIKPGYRESIQSKFAADFEEVDFAEPMAAIEKMNDWVDDRTNGKIPKLFSAPLSRDVQLVATNAIHFKADWMHRFDPKLTMPRDFFLRGEKKVQVPTMVLTERFRFWSSPSLKLLELPYLGDAFSAVLLLPAKQNGMSELEKELTAANLQKWFQNLEGAIVKQTQKPPKVTVFLPKFQFSTEDSLEDSLQDLGIKTVFSSNADLSGISDDRLFLSKVVHKAFVQVDEKGTVAAASTGGVVGASLPEEFVANRPFLFLIREQKTGAILFLGRVENPSERNSEAKKE